MHYFRLNVLCFAAAGAASVSACTALLSSPGHFHPESGAALPPVHAAPSDEWDTCFAWIEYCGRFHSLCAHSSMVVREGMPAHTPLLSAKNPQLQQAAKVVKTRLVATQDTKRAVKVLDRCPEHAGHNRTAVAGLGQAGDCREKVAALSYQ